MPGIGERSQRRSQANRTSSARSAQSRKCPRCLRLAALGAPVIWPGEGRVRKCLYCGHECGIVYGQLFGRDVTPEPGAKA